MKRGTGAKKAAQKKTSHKTTAHKKVAHKKMPRKSLLSQTHNVDIQYTQDVKGNQFINVPPYTTVKPNDDVDFVLDPNADASDFTVTFKESSPFEDNGGHNINKAHHKTGKCNGAKGDYSYNVAIKTNGGNTVTIDPVIIVDP
jgi:hypothetical protein